MVVTDEAVHVDGHGHQERERKWQLCTNGRVTELVLVLTLLVVAAVVLSMAETESDYRNHASVTSIDSGHDIANTSINTLSPLPPLPLPRLLSLAMSWWGRTTPVTLELLRSLPLSAIKSTIVINSSSNAFTTITTTTVTNAAVTTLLMRVATKYQHVSKALAEVKSLRMTG